jgi:hypothetical protein
MKLETLPRKKMRRTPLRTFKEMAEELCVDWKELRHTMRHHSGPIAKLHSKGSIECKNKWYEPKEFRAWFNALPEDVKASLQSAKG